MTEKKREKNKPSVFRAGSRAPTFLGIISLVSLFLLLRAPAVTLDRTSEALSLCVRTVIPSLFPFLVVSELLLSGDSASLLAPLFRRPAKFLFGIKGESAVAVLLGFLCGFPVGAKGAAALYKSGRIDGGELEKILTFSCIPSAPFLISTVGASMFGDTGMGLRMLAASLLSSLIIGVGVRKIKFKSSRERAVPFQSDIGCEQSAARLFTSAVSSSALSMLYVCAFLTFFSTLMGVIEYAVGELALPPALSALFLGFFELTGGIRRASELPSYGVYLAAAIGGWSGLSVHFQVMSVCGGCNISFKPYFLAKLASALLCPVLLFIISALTGDAI